MKRFLCGAVIMAISILVFAGGKKDTPASTGEAGGKKIDVMAVNFPAYDFVRAVSGGRVNLAMLLPPGAESHSFEPAPRDIVALQNCELFIYTGGESDTWVSRILESLDTKNMRANPLRVIRMMDAVDVVEEEIVEGMEEEAEEEEGIAYDEHVWTSPKNARRIVGILADALCEVSVANAVAANAEAANIAIFRENAQNYISALDELDKEFQAVVDKARRKTLVFGDRFPFRYFADAYGLDYFAAFPGCSTESEASAATVAFLINKVKAEKIPVIFHIELSNEKMADIIAAETGAKKRLFHAGHNITKQDFDSGLTFLEIQRANVPALREALQ